MTQYASSTAKAPRPKTRTWATVTTYTAHGEHWGTARHTVTLTRDAAGTMTAEVNGQPAPLARAVGILQGADTATLTHEAYLGEPAPIGKRRACELHRLMGQMGVPSHEHYGFAGAALDRPVYSLAALTEAEARAVSRFLCATHGRAAV
ncbi:hypothetical protein [Deinococcus aestuarii]|uniref:hypothetical protein n=1 Tax=Deinococcus aestuarii TaxID=2774531 RepID=UPI001C0D536C|nr:hypothetical protein [Deinococcus aestuarii]